MKQRGYFRQNSLSCFLAGLQTQLSSLRNHAHDTGTANPQYPVDRVLPIRYPRRGSTQSPGYPSSVADPWQSPPPIAPNVSEAFFHDFDGFDHLFTGLGEVVLFLMKLRMKVIALPKKESGTVLRIYFNSFCNPFRCFRHVPVVNI
jgi:hypothetical protein